MMVRPASFGFNPETAASNAFQQNQPFTAIESSEKAQKEFDYMVDLLRSHEIEVLVVDDTATPIKPDAIFPNNWISFHHDGTVVLYPMLAENRRLERRQDIVEVVAKNHRMARLIDLSVHEHRGLFLEGTGSIVFDYMNKIAYASRSPRTHDALLIQLCSDLGFQPVIFNASDEGGQPIYHTNVLMGIGEKFVVICLDAIKDDSDQERILLSFERTGHKVIAISFEQMKSFAGNLIEVASKSGESFVLMSETAFQSLLPGQINAISQFSEILPVRIPHIERIGGGSVRCMVAGVFLPGSAV